jgi:putative endonuclease
MYHIYILKCSDGSLYTGFAKDLGKRLEVHRKGLGSKYVRARLPFELVYTEEFEDKIKAYQREYEIKRWSRERKIREFKLVIKN